MNSFIRYISAVTFVLVLAMSASAYEINPAELSPVERTEIGEDVVHYTYEVTVDTDAYAKIRLHRFIRETYPYQPIPNLKGVLFLPGGWATIMGVYAASLSSEHVAWDHSLLVYLAKNNIDFWGMDFAWALVPAETEDFHFMKNWTITRDVRHAEAALSIAQSIREYTGQGTSKLILAGHSYGGLIPYGVLSEESQKPAQARNAGGLITVDSGPGVPRDDTAECPEADNLKSSWDSGTYAADRGLFIGRVAWLAESNPEGPSDIVPGFSNYVAFLFIGANLFIADYKKGVPTGFRFTDPQFAIEGYQGFAPYLPVKALEQMWELLCSHYNIQGFEHIDQIDVPVLPIGAGDVGYGHGDPFAANDAEDLVWEPILDWINAH
jgi:hypothetical protein